MMYDFIDLYTQYWKGCRPIAGNMILFMNLPGNLLHISLYKAALSGQETVKQTPWRKGVGVDKAFAY